MSKGVTYTTMISTDGKRAVYGVYRVPTRAPLDKIAVLNMHKADWVSSAEMPREIMDRCRGLGADIAPIREWCFARAKEHETAEFPAFEWGVPR